MSHLLKIGLLLCALGGYFLFTWRQGESAGESFHRFRQDKGTYIKRADEPARFEANQRNLRVWGLICAAAGALTLATGFFFRQQRKPQ